MYFVPSLQPGGEILSSEHEHESAYDKAVHIVGLLSSEHPRRGSGRWFLEIRSDGMALRFIWRAELLSAYQVDETPRFFAVTLAYHVMRAASVADIALEIHRQWEAHEAKAEVAWGRETLSPQPGEQREDQHQQPDSPGEG